MKPLVEADKPRGGPAGNASASFIMYDCSFKEHSHGGVALLIEEHAPEIREDKVLEIRQQIAEGRYNIGDRLDAVIATLLDLFGG